MMGRRFGRPGLLGTMARTAVVAGTASAVVGGMSKRQQARSEEAAEQQAAQQAAFESQAELAEMKQQLAETQAQQASTPAPKAAPADDLTTKLKQLSELKSSGALTDEEFKAAKAKLLG